MAHTKFNTYSIAPSLAKVNENVRKDKGSSPFPLLVKDIKVRGDFKIVHRKNLRPRGREGDCPVLPGEVWRARMQAQAEEEGNAGGHKEAEPGEPGKEDPEAHTCELQGE